MRRPSRNAIAALSVSAAAFVALVGHEGYTDRAVIPVKGDRPTVGFGSTFREDGAPVQMGDTITPQKAIARSLAHIQKDEAGIKACITAPLSQAEFDLMTDFSYQYGVVALCKSSIVREANAGRYVQSCEAYKEFRLVRAAPGERPGPGFVVGKDGILRYDCSTPGNRRCSGVWARSQERYQTCMAAQ
jgi:lysozyme